MPTTDPTSIPSVTVSSTPTSTPAHTAGLAQVQVFGARLARASTTSTVAAPASADATAPYETPADGAGAPSPDGAEGSRQRPMFEDAYKRGWLIAPPTNYARHVELLDESDILIASVAAMETNVAAFGINLVPYDPDAHREATEESGGAAAGEGSEALPEGTGPVGAPDGKGKARGARDASTAMHDEIVEEKKRLALWFENAAETESFISLCRRTRVDLEVFADAYWEVRRDAKGRVAALSHVPTYYVRKGPLDGPLTRVKIKVRGEDGRWKERWTWRRFRKLAQWVNGFIVWFKEFGDPRKLNYETGEWDEKTPREKLATELFTFSLYAPGSIYGKVRWRGSVNDIAGRSNASALNNDTLDNRGIPPYLIMVSGGQLIGDAGRSVTDTIREHFLACKQRENWNVPLVLNAASNSAASLTGDGPATPVRIDVEDLTKGLQNDAHFTTYRGDVVKDVAMCFRLPDIYLGRGSSYNRATAMAAKEVAEEQVFAPERALMDDAINRRLLPELGAVHWVVKSNGPPLLDEERLSKILDVGVKGFALTPAQIASVIEPLLGISLQTSDDWAKIPVAALAALAAKGALPESFASLVGTIVNALGPGGSSGTPGGQGGATPGFEDPNVPSAPAATSPAEGDGAPAGDGGSSTPPADDAPTK